MWKTTNAKKSAKKMEGALRVFFVILGLAIIIGVIIGVTSGELFEPWVVVGSLFFGCISIQVGFFWQSFKDSNPTSWQVALNFILIIGGFIFWFIAEEQSILSGTLIAQEGSVSIYLKSHNYKPGDNIKLIVIIQGDDILRSKITRVSTMFAGNANVLYQSDEPLWGDSISSKKAFPSQKLVLLRIPASASSTNCSAVLDVEYAGAQRAGLSNFNAFKNQVNIPITLLPEP